MKIRVLLAVCSLILTMATVEIILHAIGFKINLWSGPHCVLANRIGTCTNSGVIGRPNEYTVKTTYNSLGYFDREHVREKPPNTRRIVVIGDSFVDGYEVPMEKKFTSKLENLFNSVSKDVKYEVISMGVPSIGPREYWWILLNHAFLFHPDIILVEFLPENDVADTSEALKSSWITWQKNVSTNQWLTKKDLPPIVHFSRLLSLGLFVADDMKREQYLSTLPEVERINPLWFVYCKKPGKDANEWDRTWQTMENAYAQMHKEAKAHGVDFYLAIFTGQFEIAAYQGKNTLPDNLVPYECNPMYPIQRVETLAKTLNIPYINLNPLFAQREKGSGQKAHYRFDRHWNETGHVWAAEEIMKAFGQDFLSK